MSETVLVSEEAITISKHELETLRELEDVDFDYICYKIARRTAQGSALRVYAKYDIKEKKTKISALKDQYLEQPSPEIKAQVRSLEAQLKEDLQKAKAEAAPFWGKVRDLGAVMEYLTLIKVELHARLGRIVIEKEPADQLVTEARRYIEAHKRKK